MIFSYVISFRFLLSPCNFCSCPTCFLVVPLRELSHARWLVVRAEEQMFFWTVVSFSTFNPHVFLPNFTRFLTTLIVFITYTIILTYKYPSILPLFLTPYHFLPLLTLSLSFSSSCFFFVNSHFGGKSDQTSSG